MHEFEASDELFPRVYPLVSIFLSFVQIVMVDGCLSDSFGKSQVTHKCSIVDRATAKLMLLS